jgi:hypothetical protein
MTIDSELWHRSPPKERHSACLSPPDWEALDSEPRGGDASMEPRQSNDSPPIITHWIASRRCWICSVGLDSQLP